MWTVAVLTFCLGGEPSDADLYPPLSDLERFHFPTRSQTREALSQNNRYQCWAKLQGDVLLHHADAYGQAVQEAKQLYRVWDLLDDAYYNGYSEQRKRWALEQLRRLDPHAYYQGLMPPPIPVWRLEERD